MATRPQYGPPLVDFSALGQWPDAYAKGQERQREEAFRQVLSGWGGTDYADLVRRAAQAGSIPGIQLASQLANAQASRAHQAATLQHSRDVLTNTIRHQKEMENTPVVVGNPQLGWDLVNRRSGVPLQPPQQAQPGPDIWSGPQGQIPTGQVPSVGPQSAITPELSASERALAEMIPQRGQGGPQYAQAGGPQQLPQMAQAQLPPWVGGAMPGAGGGGAPAAPPARRPLIPGLPPKPGSVNKLSAGDQKAIRDAENDNVQLQGTIQALRAAKELNPHVFTGITAGTRGYLGSNVPGANMLPGMDEAGSKATLAWQKIMQPEALKSMANTLTGATTDFELRTFIGQLADPSTPTEIRGQIIDRMMELAEHQARVNQMRMDQMREGTYYQPGGGASTPGPAAPAPASKPAGPSGTTSTGVPWKIGP